jgi:8-oxo-dGTP diphosphatase
LVRLRRRGTAIVEFPRGILVVSEGGNRFLLPGGGARHHESRQDAAIRELREETGLGAVDCQFLFECRGGIHRGGRGGPFRDVHKVFRIFPSGVPTPRREIRYLAYYNGSNVIVSRSTRGIIEEYLGLRKGSNTKATEQKDYYEILGVRAGVSWEEIERAYTKLAQEWHPDKMQGGTESQRSLIKEKMQEINEARDALRKQYSK